MVIAGVSIAVPVADARCGGPSARQTLLRRKAWLGQNNATVMAVVLLVLGATVLGDGPDGV